MTSPLGRLRPHHAPARAVGDLVRTFDLLLGDGVDRALTVTGVAVGSDDVQPGDLFVAVPGARSHGAAYARAARDRGAVAVLTDEAGREQVGDVLPVLVHRDPRGLLGPLSAWVWGQPAGSLTLVGVTGTNGKTTTTFFAEAALRGAHAQTALLGTIEVRVAGEAARSPRTTLEAPVLHGMFALMAERGVTACAMEISSHALDLGRVNGLQVDVAGFTNLQREHMDYHADMEEYFAAKARLFTPEHARRAVVCVDDEWGRRLAEIASVPVETLATRPGTQAAADWRVGEVQVHPDGSGTTFTLAGSDGPDTSVRVTSPLPGAVNVSNAALAVLMAYRAGVDLGAAAAGVATVTGVPGRMERVVPRGDGLPLCLVDYAHTPDAIGLVLQAARELTPGRVIIVFGSDGERDSGKRPYMGAAAAREADVVFVTDENPRFEPPEQIRGQILEGVREVRPDGRDVVEARSRREAVRDAFAMAGEQDTVIVTGKGHETTQEIAGVHHVYDDRDELRALAAARAGDPAVNDGRTVDGGRA